MAGQVQGVGFRPFVYRLAHELKLSGSVGNTPEGVIIEIQGPAPDLDRFARDLVSQAPPLARIVSCQARDMAPLAPAPRAPRDPRDPRNPVDTVDTGPAFVIQASTKGAGHNVLISPDTGTCDDCLAEIFDPDDRRHLYPFTNCTNCGPRYTITRSIPYDRPVTSMACFPMCPACQGEYDNPLDRRFHAQPNACPVCGPKVWLVEPRDNGQDRDLGQGPPALERLAQELAQGRIAAVKGLGGFHLACDAGNQEAVLELRARKNRWDKPLAVMVPDLDTARELVRLDPDTERLMTSQERPIVLCPAMGPRTPGPGHCPGHGFPGRHAAVHAPAPRAPAPAWGPAHGLGPGRAGHDLGQRQLRAHLPGQPGGPPPPGPHRGPVPVPRPGHPHPHRRFGAATGGHG